MYSNIGKKRTNIRLFLFYIVLGIASYLAFSHVSSFPTLLSDVKYIITHIYGEVVERTLITIETYRLNS